MKSDDLPLIEATLAGNKEAFGQLVHRYQDRLFRTLVHMLGSVDDARDASQDAFLSAFQKLSTFRKESSFYSWLFRIAYNSAISNHRKSQRRLSSIDQTLENSGQEPSDQHSAVSPSHRLEVEESVEMLQSALLQLTPEYRDAIVLKELEGLRYDEVAEVLECPIGTVRSRIYRARIELKQILERLALQQSEPH